MPFSHLCYVTLNSWQPRPLPVSYQSLRGLSYPLGEHSPWCLWESQSWSRDPPIKNRNRTNLWWDEVEHVINVREPLLNVLLFLTLTSVFKCTSVHKRILAFSFWNSWNKLLLSYSRENSVQNEYQYCKNRSTKGPGEITNSNGTLCEKKRLQSDLLSNSPTWTVRKCPRGRNFV